MRFKSILGAFIFIGLASMIAMVVFIQTKSFGRIATKVISDISQKKRKQKSALKALE